MSESTVTCKICGQKIDVNTANCPVCSAANEQAIAVATATATLQANKKLLVCKACGQEIAKTVKACPKCGAKNKKPVYLRPWVWLLGALALIIAISGISSAVNSSRREALDAKNRSDPTLAHPPASYYELQGERPISVEQQFKDAGFSNIQLVSEDGASAEQGTASKVTINGKDFSESGWYKKNAKVTIYFETLVETELAAAAATTHKFTEKATKNPDDDTTGKIAGKINEIKSKIVPSNATDVEITTDGIDYVSGDNFEDTVKDLSDKLNKIGAIKLSELETGYMFGINMWTYIGTVALVNPIEVVVTDTLGDVDVSIVY